MICSVTSRRGVDGIRSQSRSWAHSRSGLAIGRLLRIQLALKLRDAMAQGLAFKRLHITFGVAFKRTQKPAHLPRTAGHHDALDSIGLRPVDDLMRVLPRASNLARHL